VRDIPLKETTLDRILYSFPLSANAHKIRSFLSILGLAYENRIIDLAGGEQRHPDFLAVNPIGEVPVLKDGDLTIFDSHAILIYLARKYGTGNWYADDLREQVQILQWLFYDANEIQNGIGDGRNHVAFKFPGDGAAFDRRARRALSVLNQRLQNRVWIALDRPTLADLCCAPMVSVADEAGLLLDDYPHVLEWLTRLSDIKGFLPMPKLRDFRKRQPG
jgi:glutathione S-transferase